MAKRILVQFQMKTIKQYSIQGFFSCLFMLIFIALPIVQLFMPFGAVTNAFKTIDGTAATEPIYYSYTMIDIIKSVFKMDGGVLMSYFQDPTGGMYPGFNENFANVFNSAMPIIYIVVMSVFFAECLAALIGLFIVLKFLFRGYWNHFGECRFFSHFGFWLQFFIMAGAQGIAILATSLSIGRYGFVNDGLPNIGYLRFSFPGWLYSLIYLGAAFVALVFIFFFYEYGLADRIYIGKKKKGKQQPNVPLQNDIVNVTEVLTPVEEVKEEIPAKKEEEPVETPTPVVEPKVEPEPKKGIPQDVPSIGGHAFAENQSVVIADIPSHIERLGDAAFSNCLSLEIVQLHKGIKSIGSNCFFNCARLKRINYEGSKKEWKNIKRGSNWLLKAGTKVVHCSDGPIQVNPFH